jgi:ribosomal protein S18 acetylase RimI-like enzyme
MRDRGTGYRTKELSTRTWKDFERLFEKPGEWGACWCVYYHRQRPLPRAEKERMTLQQRAARNRRDKRRLVFDGVSHGILVYSGGDPVGWCQYGLKHELPRIDGGRKYRRLSLGDSEERLWRITCFCVARNHRRRGVAEAGLDAALDSIRRKGGGTVEAYPVTRRGALATWFGTASMFKRQGFEVVAPFGKSNVLMRRTI